jgi:hypothetical protein
LPVFDRAAHFALRLPDPRIECAHGGIGHVARDRAAARALPGVDELGRRHRRHDRGARPLAPGCGRQRRRGRKLIAHRPHRRGPFDGDAIDRHPLRHERIPDQAGQRPDAIAGNGGLLVDRRARPSGLGTERRNDLAGRVGVPEQCVARGARGGGAGRSDHRRPDHVRRERPRGILARRWVVFVSVQPGAARVQPGSSGP